MLENNVNKILTQKIDRIEKAINLGKGDRVPFCTILGVNAFQANYAGYSTADLSNDPNKFGHSKVKLVKDFDIDMPFGTPGQNNTIAITLGEDYPDLRPSIVVMTGRIHSILQDKFTKWPGQELDQTSVPQFVGKKFLELDEYDEFIENPPKFINQKIFPRAYRSLENTSSGIAYGALIKWGKELFIYNAAMQAIRTELRALGCPQIITVNANNPYDFIADFVRDFDQAIIDFHRNPEKIEAAAEAMLPYIMRFIEKTTNLPPEAKKNFDIQNPIVIYPLHLNEFLNRKFYNNYYWPMMKKLINADIKSGRVPLILFEGDHTPHLETLLDLPDGKIIAHFERPNWSKVVEVLKGRQCVMGGIPTSLMVTGTPQDVEEKVREMLELFDGGKGFILSFSHYSLPGDTKVENMRAVVNSLNKYS
mgnify:CR=1 FL=1